ncbi:DUF6415 family natural product biosynthesis protein [Streptomyces xanthochromogenes]|uniref:Uncharacterized protein n=1 Tax=Streptomyces xanthochromogenes TaxID=67384 RepID=A0ABQ2ZHQ4_9ACTN|nr:DUF6415 family natural product biosynthesis protein [Streptomyces xanthochromogenes]GGY13504.1 hypothetical protein GCM10010326_00990 [Streptomyces xanthochromogenes]
MYRPLSPRPDTPQGAGAGLAPERDPARAAAETVALVLDEDSPLPEQRADLEELVRRLRGHIFQLGVEVPPRESALKHAQQLGLQCVPDACVASRVYLVQLAEATKELAAVVQAHRGVQGTTSLRRQVPAHWWKPQLNVVRGMVFAAALALVMLAASIPRT